MDGLGIRCLDCRPRITAAEAQLRAGELALTTSQERYRVGAATLVEVTQARATQA